MSIVRRRFQRSTNTPASGPTTRTGAAVAMSAPLAAAGAQGWPLAMIVAIHSRTVIVKTMSPVAETDWPSQSSRQFLLRQRPDCEYARMAANPRSDGSPILFIVAKIVYPASRAVVAVVGVEAQHADQACF